MIFGDWIRDYVRVSSTSGYGTQYMIGALTGLGYTSSIFLPGCVGAGFEMAASGFTIFNVYCLGYYPLWEFIVLPIPDMT